MKKMTELEKNSQNGQAVGFMLIKSAEKKISVKGSPYLDMVLSDKGGEIPAKVWDYQGKDDEYAPGEIIKVKGLIDKWKNASQLKVERIRHTTPLDSVDMSTLVATTQLDPADMLNEIRKTVEEFSDEGLKVLVTKLLDDCGEKLLICSAAVRMHHAMRGGLLFHTLSMLRVSKAVCSVYPFLRKDLVYAGIIVHDLFKLKEISFADTGLARQVYRQLAAELAKNQGRDFTDDCRLFENCGKPVYTVMGDYGNIKITTPEDIPMAQSILNIRGDN